VPKKSLLEYLEQRLDEPAAFPRVGESSWHCPFCAEREGDESSKRKFGINLFKRMAHCFRCGYSAHTLARFFMDLNGGNITVEEIDILRGEPRTVNRSEVRSTVLEILYGTDDPEADVILKPQPLPPECLSLTDSQKNPLAHRAYRYLRSRGVRMDKIKQYDIRFCPKGAWASHLIFPVYQMGELVYWTTRTINPNAMHKSKNPLNADGYYSSRHCLLNYDNCVGHPVVSLGEGPFDMMALCPGMGSLGKNLSETQVKLIENLVKLGTEELVIAVDAGEGKAADAYFQALVGRVPKVSQLVLDYGDPDERRDEIQVLLRERRPPSVVDRVKSRLTHRK